MKDFDTDVIIVGAGPTGLMLAGELRLAGVDVIVAERLAEPMAQSRALGFSARTIEEFDQRGLLPRFGEIQTIPFGHFGGVPIDYRVLQAGSFGARGVPQSVTEKVLAGWATGLGATICREVEVTGLDVDDGSDGGSGSGGDVVSDGGAGSGSGSGSGGSGSGSGGGGVTVRAATPDGPRSYRARYVAGCDGGHSTVRRLAGIDFPGTDPVIEMWFADVAGCGLRPRFSGERVPGGSVMVLPMGPDSSRVILHERGAMRRKNGGAPTFAEVADAWQRLTGEDIHGGTPSWTSYVTDSSRQAARYRKGRIFLLGDAAHVHLPIGAQGMSAGIGDAVNLGWKLAAAVHGHAPAGLLDTYHTERHPVGARILANTLAQRTLYLSGEEMAPMQEVLAELTAYEEVQRHLAGMVTGLDIRYDVGPRGSGGSDGSGDPRDPGGPGGHPLLGRRLPNIAIGSPGTFSDPSAGNSLGGASSGAASVFELLHSGRGVLLDLADDPGLRAAAGPWEDRVRVVTAADPAGELAGALAGAVAVMVRPDGYIAWIGSGTAGSGGSDGLPDALARWFGEPREAAAPIP